MSARRDHVRAWTNKHGRARVYKNEIYDFTRKEGFPALQAPFLAQQPSLAESPLKWFKLRWGSLALLFFLHTRARDIASSRYGDSRLVHARGTYYIYIFKDTLTFAHVFEGRRILGARTCAIAYGKIRANESVGSLTSNLMYKLDAFPSFIYTCIRRLYSDLHYFLQPFFVFVFLEFCKK